MSDEQNVTEAPTELVSALTGRKYDPVVRKEKPQIVVTLELAEPAPQPAPVELADPMVFVETGPAARRAEPAVAVAETDTKVAQLQRATKPDRTNDEQRLAEAKASLQPIVALARTIRADLRAFDAEHGAYLREVAAIDFAKFKALSLRNVLAVQRLEQIEHLVGQMLHTITQGPFQLAGIKDKVEKLSVHDLRRSLGRDQNVILAVEAIQAPVIGLRGIREELESRLQTLRALVDEFYTRAEASGWLKPQSDLQMTEILTPEELESRERARRPFTQRYAANSGDGTKPSDADWNPLDYSPRRN